MTGMAFPTLPLFHGLMDGDITHTSCHLPVTTKAEAGSFLPQENTTDDAMGKMTRPAGIISHRLVNLALLKFGSHIGMAILAALAYSLTGPFLDAGSQSANQKNQDYKLS
jgi:hypothetical protein